MEIDSTGKSESIRPSQGVKKKNKILEVQKLLMTGQKNIQQGGKPKQT